MIEGLSITVIGMAIVFSVLILIAGCISTFKYIFKAKPPVEKPVPAPVQIQPQKTEEKKDDRELVAVITACIAAGMNVSVDSIIVKSVRKVPGWRNMATHEQQF